MVAAAGSQQEGCTWAGRLRSIANSSTCASARRRSTRSAPAPLARAGAPPCAPEERRDGSSEPERAGQHATLPIRLADAGAVALVLDVQRAKLVSVKQERGRAVEIDQARLFEHFHAAQPAVVGSQKEVAVAVQECQSGAAARQSAKAVGDVELELPDPIVAYPGFEQVPQDIDCLGLSRRTGQEGPEPVGNVGARRTQVQVRNEKGFSAGIDRTSRPEILASRAQRISTRSMTTGSTGTSWCGPRASVGTKRISSTTSMPSMTRPNTA